jgi:hypothetical protein
MKMVADEGMFDEIFCLFQELIERAKEEHDESVLAYIIPVFKEYAEALIEAKKKNKSGKKGFLLPNVKKLRQLS